jgi:hypothetical protein
MSISALGTTNGTAKFISSAGVGLIWSALSPVLGFAFATITMAAGTVMLARLRHLNLATSPGDRAQCGVPATSHPRGRADRRTPKIA